MYLYIKLLGLIYFFLKKSEIQKVFVQKLHWIYIFCSPSGILSLPILKYFLSLLDSTNCYHWSTIAFVCFSRTFPNGEYVNLACSVICLWLEDNISSPVRYSYLSIFPDDNADTFATSLLISYCNFSILILLSKRFFLKCKEWAYARVASITKKEYGFAVHFLYRLIKSWKSIYKERLNAICWSSCLFGIFIIQLLWD